MPTYEYECAKCGKHFDLFQSIKAEPIRRCPKCKGKVKRLIGIGAGIIFKGSGFYETDYKRKSGGKPEKSEGDAKSVKESGAKNTSSDTTKKTTKEKE
jgi:putative FmdB family regulatory protein